MDRPSFTFHSFPKMPVGRHFTAEQKYSIFYGHFYMHYTPEQIFSLFFYGDIAKASVRTIENHTRYLEFIRDDPLEQKMYLLAPVGRGGGQRPSIDPIQRTYLLHLFQDKERNIKTVSQLHRQFVAEFFGGADRAPSLTTITNFVHDEHFSRKVMERCHILRSPTERLRYLESIAYVMPQLIVDLDETASSPDQFKDRYGWAPIGKKCIQTQIVINNVHYSAIAAYTIGGFLCWDVVEGSYTSQHFIAFLNNTLQPMLQSSQYLILDNVRVHKTDDALVALENVSRGKYFFSPRYSPDFKPIEEGFADIKRELRQNEIQASLDPIGWINRTFEKFAIGGECGHRGEQ